MKPLLWLLLLAWCAHASAATDSNITVVATPAESRAIVTSTWGYDGDKVSVSLVLAPGAVRLGGFKGYSVRLARQPVTAATLEREYTRGQAKTQRFPRRIARLTLARDEIPTGYVAVHFSSPARAGGDVVYCIPLTILEQACRADLPAVAPTLPPVTPPAEALAPVIEPPRT